jgi:chemotaxis protein methyltransferase CheR
MFRGGSARFEHINFPREQMHRTAINLAPTGPRQSLSSAQLPAWSQEEMEFVTWLLALSGLDACCYRPETLQRRLPACLRRLRARSLQHAREVLVQDPGAVAAATSAILVGVTSFFRDPTVFEQLGQEVRRTVEERSQGAYAWSIGCSEGAELYSLGMQLAESGHLADSYLLGTDCRVDAIEQARAGNYEAALTRQVPPTFLSEYFERNGTCLRICQHLRQSIRWRVSSILNEFESGLWDVIFFRNTALYLSPAAVMALWPKLEAALRPGGLLVLGRAERPYGAQRLRAIGPCLYRRQAR